MPAPTKDFRSITDARIDADSPLDQQLLTDVRDALEHVKEWLGYGYTAAQAHSHDGVDSALLPANNAANMFNYTNFI